MSDRKCSVDGCERKHASRGWCFVHYGRWKRHGDPLCWVRLPAASPARDRILRNVTVDEHGCWRWQGSKQSAGYGNMFFDGSMKYVHRVAYEAWVAPIPDGLEIDHLCRVVDCCNPAHLEPVTGRVNTLRSLSPSAINIRKTHCPQGHAYDEANTYRHPKTGWRMCKACNRIRARNRWLATKGAVGVS